jgi:DNA-binding NarL/FixJ family response regulator
MSDGNRPLRVVVVEDSEAFLLRLKLALKLFPQLEVVGVAESASAAISLVDTVKPDLVLLDLYLKQGSGVDVLRHINETGLKVRTLVMTSEESGELRLACLSLGASRFFDKAGLIDALPGEVDSLSRELSGPNSAARYGGSV